MKLLLPVFVCLLLIQQTHAGDSTDVYTVLRINSIHRGKNIYVQNPYRTDQKTFCTQKVLVNGIQHLGYVNTSAYEIDLSHIKMNDSLKVEIYHHKSCKPKILNPSMHPLIRRVGIRDLRATADSVFFRSKDDNKKSTFYLEHFLYNQWVVVDTIASRRNDSVWYRTKPNYHSGINKLRVKNIEIDGMVSYSTVVTFELPRDHFNCHPTRVVDTLILSQILSYELLDYYGAVVKTGKGQLIDMSGLPSGIYYIQADNQTRKVFKK